jgi:hypothetical protein
VLLLSDKIVWIAAYPKTGSTWLRAIIQQLLAPDTRAKEAIPSLYQEYPEDAPVYPVMGTEAKILRTHCHPDHRVFKQMTRNRSDEIVGVITIQRHPLDVLLSQLNYSFILGHEKSFKNGELKKVEDIVAAGEIDEYIDAFINTDGCPEHAKRCKSYPDFYAKWQALAPGAPHLHLRYEEMVREQAAGIGAVQSFLGLPVTDTFELATRVEDRTKVNGKFYWRKKAYNFRELLPEASIRRFEERFSKGLEALGYAGSDERELASLKQ